MSKNMLIPIREETHQMLKVEAAKTNQRLLALVNKILEKWVIDNCFKEQ